MAFIEKRGDKYRVRVRRKGLGAVSRSFLKKADAQGWAREAESALERGTFEAAPKAHAENSKTTTLAELVERYRDTISVRKKGKEFETYILNALLRHKLAQKKLIEATSSEWAQYRDERLKEIKPASLKRQFVIIHNLYEVARDEWGFDVPNPLTKVKLEYTDQRRDRRLKEGEWERIIAGAKTRKNPFVLQVLIWAKETGMRRGEILAMRWQHVDLKSRCLLIPEAKNGHSRVLPITTEMLAILETSNLENDRVFPIAEANFKSTLKRIFAKLGLSGDLRMHDLRHEAISRLFERGLGIHETASISGHKSWKMLARYTHPKPADILKKLESVAA
jgi:integrase